MDIPADLLPGYVLWPSGLVYLLIVGAALRTAPWWKLDNEAMHVFLGACVVLIVVWSLRAGIHPGLNFHLLGVTAIVLMFGWSFAFLAVNIVLLAVTLNGQGGWETFPLNALLMGASPIVVTLMLLSLTRQKLPSNFFIYIFVNAFLAAGLATTITSLAATGLILLGGAHDFARLSSEYLPFTLLMILPEALFNGMIMTLLVVFKPAWVSSFDDEVYLRGK